MARCNQCGSELPDYYTSCPNCGGSVVRQAPPVHPAQPMNGYVPMAQQREVTSMGAWFGWSLLCGILPIIGPIIMLNSAKDPTAKNYAKLMLIMQAIGIVLLIIFGAILIPAMIGYIEKANRVRRVYGMIAPFLLR